MLDDQSIWNAIGQSHKFCSFKMKTDTEEVLCKNANNVSGICSRSTCPLANSKYATVRAINDKLYLLLKEPERVHKPRLQYEKILLDSDYKTALSQIDKEVKDFGSFLVHKCKQRLTKLSDYLERKELLDKIGRPNYIKRRKKAEKQDRARETKAVKVAKIEKSLESEILERFSAGVYGNRTILEQEKKTEQEKKREKVMQIQTKGIRYVTEFEESVEEEEEEKKKKRIKLEW
ncbi:protein MAK16 [Nematocida homosporus]|uniref:protein MAK16 n=1 Tax=Nematocida homosporus TaxID=1912981 RepID=UPI00221EF658|nr:protein MAK16 [Nematocida homosporus]KAI5184540.1 protein MAK16 [Nematocida homosporus]